jgi:hypothetical protein
MSDTDTKPAKRTRRSYTEAEIVRGLAEVARAAGSARLASKRLKEAGNPIAHQTLERWAKLTHRDKYLTQAKEIARQVEEDIVQDMRENITLAAQAEQAALTATLAQLEQGVKDPSAIARNLSVTKGVNLTHLLTYTGRPTQITEHRSLQDLDREIERRLGSQYVDSTAEDITDTPLAVPELNP